MARTRRRRKGPPRCRDCDQPITLKRSPWGGGWRPFEPKPVDGRSHVGARAFPVEGVVAWSLEELIEELMGRHQYGRDEAKTEAFDMPWYVLHECRPPAENGSEE